MLDLWYKNAVIYCLDVDSFKDSGGDGWGDFRGLTDMLHHVQALGATCIWLLPFYPSPNRDNGYDVADFYGVHPHLGTPGDFVAFTREARNRGIKVIIDLVVNHTSVDHPWFQAARRDKDSPYRDYYIWAETKPADAEEGLVFPGVQESTWSWDETAGAWYFHRFYWHQPDLNIVNPAVREEIQKIMGYWLELGVCGFRLDAVPFLIAHEGGKPRPDNHEPLQVLDELHRFLSWRKAEAILLAEANIPMDTARTYFGNGSRVHMVFHFILNQQLFLAFARGDATPVLEVLRQAPDLPATGQWATFLRNHDELDLGRLSPDERQEVFDRFGPDPSMQLYHRGLRRRLAPMFGGDRRRLDLAYSLLFALPGTPVLWYGEELGMGEDLALPERNAVRTPMPWNDGRNAGFSAADPASLVRPVVRDGPLGSAYVNVEAQAGRRGSLLEHVRRVVRTRNACPEVGWARPDIVETGCPSVIALRQAWRNGEILTLHNLADHAVTVTPWMRDDRRELKPLLADVDDAAPCPCGAPVALGPFGYRWYRVEERRA